LKFRDWMIYVAMRCLLGVLQLLPWSAARPVARRLGDVGYLLDRPRRKAKALSNLQAAFPGLDQAEAKRILRGVYCHLAECVLDALKFAYYAYQHDAMALLEPVGWEKLDQVPRQTGLIFAGGHFGHWEVLGTALPILGYPTWTMARPRGNQFVESRLRRLREATGQQMLPKDAVARRMIRLLRAGENVGLLADQDARRHGIFVEFFGRMASTTPSVAAMSFHTGAPVAFVYARRIPGQNRFRVVLKDVIVPDPQGDKKAEVRRITESITANLEELVRDAPQEWLWLHRRWKTHPGKHPGMQ